MRMILVSYSRFLVMDSLSGITLARHLPCSQVYQLAWLRVSLTAHSASAKVVDCVSDPRITRNARKTHKNTKKKKMREGDMNIIPSPVPHTKLSKFNEIHEKGGRGEGQTSGISFDLLARLIFIRMDQKINV